MNISCLAAGTSWWEIGGNLAGLFGANKTRAQARGVILSERRVSAFYDLLKPPF